MSYGRTFRVQYQHVSCVAVVVVVAVVVGVGVVGVDVVALHCITSDLHYLLRSVLSALLQYTYGAAVAQLVEAAGSIPDDVTGILHWHNPSGRTKTLGSTQPITEISKRNISWGVMAAGA